MLTADATEVCPGGILSATPNGDIVVPTDYEVVYVLTSGAGLVIEQAGASPSFTVSTPGDYTIHTLVAETSDNTSPDFLDLSIINFGTTPASDVVALLEQGGGSICGSLDVTGAPITVLAANDPACNNDCNDGLTAAEICAICNTTDGTNQSNTLCALDCDNDNISNAAECDNGTDPTDPDTDGDGNPDDSDPNPLMPRAEDDMGGGPPNVVVTVDVLGNDDYLPNNDPANLGTTTLTDLGIGTATGVVMFDATDGTLDYIPTPAEAGMTVTIDYQVCNDESGAPVCTAATVTITVAACPSPVDTDGDGLTDCEETTGIDDPTTPTDPGGMMSDPNDPCDPDPSAVASGDCDGDGNPNGTDPTDDM
ncbi:MAG: hypothetical protein NXI25_24040, partial [bacterium]|nr:hypothetical protein [bacterium]